MPKACAISRSYWVARMTRPIRVRVSRNQVATSSSDRGGDDRQLVAGIAEPREQDAVGERRFDGPRLRAVEGQRHLLDDVEHADRGDDRRFRIVVQPPQHQAFGDQRHGADHQRADDERREEAERRVAGDHGATTNQATHGAEHEELAMRDVDDPHDAEHQRQAERRQRQHRRGDQAFEGGQQEVGTEGHLRFLVLDWWPLARGVAIDLINNSIVSARQQLSGSCDQSGPAELRGTSEVSTRPPRAIRPCAMQRAGSPKR